MSALTAMLDPNNPTVRRAEAVAEEVVHKSKQYLPTIGRILLVSTFIDDGLRMYFQWDDQTYFFNLKMPWILAALFVLVNMFSQLVASTMIVIRKHVHIAVGVLAGVVVVQTFAYSVLWSFSFFLRNLSLIGGLLLLFAERIGDQRIVFAGVPTVETSAEKQKNFLVLSGRILTTFMFITLLHGPYPFFKVIFALIGTALIILVAVGYKTKLSALILAMFLFISNLFLNQFWAYNSWDIYRDYYKYDFFQTLSVIGGLLLVVCLGPGNISVDVRKKAY